MCRRCGERDKRGNSKDRARLKRAILARDGDGTTVQCTWGIHAKCPGTLTYETMERDRIEPGGPYTLANLVASCGPCNRARYYRQVDVPAGCIYGPVDGPADLEAPTSLEIVGGFVDDAGMPVEQDTPSAVA